MANTVLIVDDDPTQQRLMGGVCEKAGFPILTAANGEDALSLLRSPKGGEVAVMMLDLKMPGLGGMETLKRAKSFREDLPVIVLTAQGGIDTVVEAMQSGAADFFVKPASPERIVVSLNNAVSMTTLQTEVSRLKRKRDGAMAFKDLIGASPALAHVMKLGERAATSTIPILITGESGTGKEMIARAIQGSSDRAGATFVTVNCGAIPENLVESVLFGHEKGAFTGATSKHAGKFKEADGGTIFLDEVGELPLEAQVKLLRVLQESEIDPVGAKRSEKVDVRVISATNRDLAEEVKEGRFREDLFYRLNVFPIEVPPLRERAGDVPALIEHFIARYNAEERRNVRGVREEVLEVLVRQSWPGNVRQLENAIFRAVVLAEGAYLSAEDFPLLAEEFAQAGVAAGPPMALQDDEDAEEFDAPAARDAAGEASDMAARVAIFDRGGHVRSLQDIERDLIALAIDTYGGKMSEIARRLGMGRSTLYRKLREHELEVKRAS